MTHELSLRITGRTLVADGVVALDLARADGGALPEWQPGAHIELALPGDFVRQYSLCSDPAARESWRVAVLYEPDGRGGSVVVHDQLAVGDTVPAGLPRNNFVTQDAAPWLSGAAGPVMFVAGGIGITPILPMLRAAEASVIDWRLLYLGRRLETMAFHEELAEFGSRVQLHPRDSHGPLALAVELDDLCDADATVFACGPQRLLETVESWCANSHARLHVEKFTPVEAIREGDTAFEVELGDGTLVEVGADESILTALTRCGIPALNSCQEGNCGTCETFILEGVAEHRDNVLSEEDRALGESMMICVSRARTPRLVLDL